MIFNYFLQKPEKCLHLQAMAKIKRYTFNPKTLSYEVKRRSRKSRVMRSVALFAGSVLLSAVYFWLYVSETAEQFSYG